MGRTEEFPVVRNEKNNFIRDAIRKSFFKKSQPVESFSRILPGPERIHENLNQVSLPEDPSVRTIYDALLRGNRLSNNGPYLGERDSNGKYIWLNYETVIKKAHCVGSALINEFGLEIGQNTRVAIAGLHTPKYIIIGHALSAYSMVFVPLYYNYKFDDLMKIVNKCRIEVLFCDNYNRAQEYIGRADELPTLKHIILLDSTENKVPNGSIENSKMNLYDWDYILKVGEANLQPKFPPKPTDTYVICYTSGTTGDPKGALISHQALLATATGPTVQWLDTGLKLGPKDVYFSFLSPAHSYEQLMEVLTTYHGAKIGIYSGSVPKLLDDLQTLQPTFLAFVPRLLTKFKAQIEAQIKQKNRFVQAIFNLAINSKIKDLNNGIVNYNKIWDKTIFKPIHKLVGGRLRFIITGGASIAQNVKQFSSIVYGCPVFEGYGQTECAAAGLLTVKNDTNFGNVGIPAPWAQIKLVSVSDLEYNSENNEGELYIRGIGLMDGYFEQPELTSQTIDSEGWLRTGDIARWRPNGTLELIDRRTNFFKLSQGDYVSPDSIEAVYQTNSLVSQIFVCGRQTESFMVAIIVPNINKIKEILEENESLKISMEKKSIEELVQSEEVRQIALKYLREYGKTKGLNELEQIRNLYLEINEFTPDNNLLTPTLKMKRPVLLQKYTPIIDEMYNITPQN